MDIKNTQTSTCRNRSVSHKGVLVVVIKTRNSTLTPSPLLLMVPVLYKRLCCSTAVGDVITLLVCVIGQRKTQSKGVVLILVLIPLTHFTYQRVDPQDMHLSPSNQDGLAEQQPCIWLSVVKNQGLVKYSHH